MTKTKVRFRDTSTTVGAKTRPFQIGIAEEHTNDLRRRLAVVQRRRHFDFALLGPETEAYCFMPS